MLIELTTWGYWKKQHPETKILSRDAGYGRDYLRSQYGDYDENGDIYFPVSFRSSQYHPKERVIGLNTNDRFKSHPLVELYRAKSPLEDLVAGLKLFYLNLRLKHRMESSVMTEVECCRASMPSGLHGTHFIQKYKFLKKRPWGQSWGEADFRVMILEKSEKKLKSDF